MLSVLSAAPRCIGQRIGPRIGLLLAILLATSASAAESIIPNGDFAQADPADARKPLHWQLPDGVGAKWLEGEGGGKAIRLDTTVSEEAMDAAWNAIGMSDFVIPKPAKDPIAATYGLSFYSDAVPVEAGRAYRLRFEFQGEGGGVKVWVRGYGQLAGEERRLYEAVVVGKGAGPGWHPVDQLVHPTKRKPDVKTVKIMLYAYWPPGVYSFRNVRLEPEDEAAPAK